MKLENVLFKNKPEYDLKICIVDFGIAGSCQPNKTEKSNAGSLSYMPPEVLDNTMTKASASIDIWALGAILFAMVMGRLPFSGHSHEEVLESIKEFQTYGLQNFTRKVIIGEEERFPPPISAEAKDLILKML